MLKERKMAVGICCEISKSNTEHTKNRKAWQREYSQLGFKNLRDNQQYVYMDLMKLMPVDLRIK